VAREVAQQVICLPIYPGLRPAQVDRILGLLEPTQTA
jgi:dTDP-4-amino-4,6-dideoxygalactose transaminase